LLASLSAIAIGDVSHEGFNPYPLIYTAGAWFLFGTVFNITRTITYTKPEARRSASDLYHGLNLAVFPCKDSKAKVYAVYSIGF